MEERSCWIVAVWKQSAVSAAEMAPHHQYSTSRLFDRSHHSCHHPTLGTERVAYASLSVYACICLH